MSFKLLGGGSSLDTVVSDMNQNILQLKNNETTEFFSDQNGIRRVQLGQGANNFYGLKVSQPGIDVYTATDNQLSYNSSYNLFKIVTKLQSTFSFTGVSTTTTTGVSITHNLGYKPLTLNVVELTTNSANSELGIFGLPYIGHGTTSGTGPSFIISCFVKQSNVTTSTISFALGIIGSLTIAGTITSYVLQETAT